LSAISAASRFEDISPDRAPMVNWSMAAVVLMVNQTLAVVTGQANTSMIAARPARSVFRATAAQISSQTARAIATNTMAHPTLPIYAVPTFHSWTATVDRSALNAASICPNAPLRTASAQPLRKS